MIDPADDPIARLLAGRRLAVVGLGDDPSRPAHRVSAFMQRAGYHLFPVHPTATAVLGVPCYRSLADIPGGPVDIVNVFRRPLACPDVVRAALAAGARGVWLQSGIVSDDARQLAAAAGLPFVQDRCIMVEHAAHH